MLKSFITRSISAVLMLTAMIGIIIVGRELLLGVIMILSIIGMYELYRVYQMEKSALAIVSYLIAITYFANLEWNFIPDIMMLWMGFLIILMFLYVFTYPKFRAKKVMAAFFGVFYVAVMLSYVYQLRLLEHGVYITFLVFICSWGCDTCAYLVGVKFGKHKMSPQLSPKKSIEGAIGGVVGTAILAAVYCCILREQMNLTNTKIFAMIAIAMAAAVVSMIGDLTASAIKRNYDIKDFGHLIPGHGGILDRFDSMIITAPIIYYLSYYLLQ